MVLILHLFMACWISGRGEVTRLHLHVGNGLSNNYVHGIVEDSRGRVWLATESGLNCFDGHGYKVYKTYNSSLKSNFINCLYNDVPRRQIIVGVKGYGIYSIDENTGQVNDITPNNATIHNVTAIKPASDGKILLYCPEKIIAFDAGTNTLASEKTREYDGHGLIPAATRTYVDHFGNRWTATLGSGVYVSGRWNNPFRQITKGEVHSVDTGYNRIWAGGNNAIYSIGKNGNARRIPIIFDNVKGSVLSLCCTGNNTILAAIGGTLISYDVETGKVSELRYHGKTVNPITFFHDDRTSITWITALDGIYSLGKRGLVRENKLNRSIRSQQSNGIRVDSNGKIWIGTFEDGMYVFKENKSLLHHYTQQSGFFTNSVMHLRLGALHRLWLATPDGIGLFDTRQPASPAHYGYRQGLNEPFIRGVADTGNSNAWVTTNNGVAYFDYKRKSFANFNYSDGVPEHNITGGIMLLPDGRLVFTTTGGLYSVDTQKLLNPGRMSRVVFTGCAVRLPCSYRADTRMVRLNEDNTFMLNHDENSFVISFAVMNKMQCQRTDYSYRILGLSNEWTLASDNTIPVMGLSPGKYTVEVRARLHGQPWQLASMASTKLIIAHPWWNSPQAWMAYALLLIAFAYISAKRYKMRLKERNDMILEKMTLETEKASNRERLTFFTDITHELRTPLTLIFGPIEQLESSKALNDEDRLNVTMLRSNADRLMALINQLLDFRKADTHNRKLNIKYGNIQSLVARVKAGQVMANRNPNVKVTVNMTDNIPKMWFDPDVIESILNNLLSNALKYTRQGEVCMALDQIVEYGKPYSRLCVSDTGCGISPIDMPHIFDRYYRAENNAGSAGTGIGLALVKALCDLHKIKLSVESKPGVGSTFTLLIDQAETYPDAMISAEDSAVTKKANATCPGETRPKGDDTKHRPVVVVVEDNNDINNYIARHLANDYLVIQAGNGEDGLKAIKANVPDLVICDVMMPVMDGNTMTRLVKQDMATSHVPVIMLTAKTTIDERQEGYESGADSYLTKPFSINMLNARIDNILSSRRMLARHILSSVGNVGTGITRSDSYKTANALPRLSIIDSQFLERLNAIIQDNLTNTQFSLTTISTELGISQSTLYRKTKALTGVTTNEYIRTLRLDHSRRLMESGMLNVSQAAYQSGFTDLAYFRQQFKQKYGMMPNEYLRGKT